MKIFFIALLVFFYCKAEENKIVIVTDAEPDDLLALMILIPKFRERIAFIGTTLLDTNARKTRVQELLELLGVSTIPVYAGMTKSQKDYPNNLSTKAILSYTGFEASKQEFREELHNALMGLEKPTTILLLTAATDVAYYLESRRNECALDIIMMGGSNPDGFASFNWDMDTEAANTVMSGRYKNVKVTLISSSAYAKNLNQNFDEGNAEGIINYIKRRKEEAVFKYLLKASGSWNNHITNTYPPLHRLEKFGPYQFCNADVIAAIELLHPGDVSDYEHVKYTFEERKDHHKVVVIRTNDKLSPVLERTRFYKKEELIKHVVDYLRQVRNSSAEYGQSSQHLR